MMKKSTLFLSVAMLAMSTSMNAQTLKGDTLQLQNPSFEESEADNADNHTVGWQTEGATTWGPKNQKTMPPNTKGAWYVRAIQTNGSIDAPNRIYQTVIGKGPGVYVLSASVNVSRNGQRGNIDEVGQGNMFGYLYIADEDDIDGAESKGYMKIGECFGEMKRLHVVYPAASGGEFEIGFGLPAESQGIPKGWLQCDDFVLTFYPGATEEEVRIATGIKNIQSDVQKNDDTIYTIDGVRVKDATAKGIYIKNGKKFVVK